MSVQYVSYNCSNCGKRTKERNTTEPVKCSLCYKIICKHCSPKGFCKTCFVKIPEDALKKLNRNYRSFMIFTVFLWVSLILGLVSLVLLIMFGTESFIAKYPNAGIIQNVSISISAIVFCLILCVIAPLSVYFIRRKPKVLTEVANHARQSKHQISNPKQSVGITPDQELLRFKSEVEQSLGSDPKTGIVEIAHNFLINGITPGNQDFLLQVRSEVAAKFTKTSDDGQAIVSFLVIALILEQLSPAKGSSYSVLHGVPVMIRDFLLSVMKIQYASSVAQGIIYGI